MPSIEIKRLINYNRLPDSTGDLFTFIIYSPLGIVLFLVRLSLLLVTYTLSAILPITRAPIIQHFLHRVFNVIFGIVVQIDNPDKREDVEVYVSNKVSLFDCTVINFLTNSICPGLRVSPLTSSILGFKHFESPLTNAEDLKRNIKKILGDDKVPILFQPEVSATNGTGLLKFNVSPFVLYDKLQPIALSVNRPFIRAAISTVSSDYWSDVFWYMFVPCTVYKVKFLPAVEKKSVSDEEFSERIRNNIANDLKIKVTNFTSNELKDLKKRYLFERQQQQQQQQQRVSTQRPTSVNPELHQMALQVREVFPLVPYEAVFKDLVKTRSVDVTITNILEGHVRYDPERSNLDSRCGLNEPSCSKNIESKPLNTAASEFGKSPQERSLSFQERKKQLIENARRKYIEKHGLNIVGS